MLRKREMKRETLKRGKMRNEKMGKKQNEMEQEREIIVCRGKQKTEIKTRHTIICLP